MRGRIGGSYRLDAAGRGLCVEAGKIEQCVSRERGDHLFIADLIGEKSRVLDVGCGDGALLDLLWQRKKVDGRGMELSQAGVNACVLRGLSVVQGDADRDLVDYPNDAFDYAILSQTLQATHSPRHVLEQLLRIGTNAIVSFPNFGFWRNRLQLGFLGRMPVTDYLPYSWFDTPNIHFCTIQDFVGLSRLAGAQIENAAALNAQGELVTFGLLNGKKLGSNATGRISAKWWLWNLLAEQAVFVLSRNHTA